MITENSFSVLAPGRIVSMTNTINFVLEYVNSTNGNIEMCDGTYMFNLKEGGIDIDNPVSVVSGKPYMKFKNKCERLPITLKLSYPLDREIYDKIENLYIL